MKKMCLTLGLPLAAIAASIANPAIAQEEPPYHADEDYGASRLADKMSDPAVQDDIAYAVEGATAAIMDLPVGRFAEAMERAVPGSVDRRRIHPDDRLGDLSGRDNRYLPQDMGDRTRSMMGAAGGMAQMFSAMLPEFKRLAGEMADRVEADVRDTRHRRN